MDIREYVKNQDKDIIIHPWEDARIEVIFKLLKKHIDVQNNLDIVDIGCGDAKVIDKLSQKLTNTTFIGIDTALDDNLISKLSQLRDNKQIKLFSSSENLEKQEINADAILLLDIIEHIENDLDFLNVIANSKYVTKDTNILITVPAFQSLYVNRDHWLGHYRRYTTKTLKKLAKENNLGIVKSGYFFSSLILIRFLQKISESKKESQEYLGINNWNGNKWSATLLKKILILDFQITNLISGLGIKIPGLSCYMICKKL